MSTQYTEETLFNVPIESPFEEKGVGAIWLRYPPQNRRAYAIVTEDAFCARATEEHVRLAGRIYEWLDKLSDYTDSEKGDADLMCGECAAFFAKSDRVVGSDAWMKTLLAKTHEGLFEEYALK